jgi:putative ubiquitin-RnfH superfamily antitoxin RatB of RatAB toxin-antitoxin module
MLEVVEVVYALPEVQKVVELPWVAGITVGEALEQSGILEEFKLDLASAKVGIFGRLCRLDFKLKPGDRVEIYRPLATDPKQARRGKLRPG